MTPDQIDAIRTFARGLPSDGTAPDTAILQLAWDYEDLQSQLAAANERADELQAVVDAARRPWADVVSYIVRDICELDVPPSNHPRCVIVDIDDVTAILHAAAPVLSQPAVVPTYEIVMSSGRKARLTAPELVDRLAACTVEIERLRGERKTRPAVVPEEVRKMRETLFDISTSDVLSDRSENTHVTVAIDRDTFRQAAILSATEADAKIEAAAYIHAELNKEQT